MSATNPQSNDARQPGGPGIRETLREGPVSKLIGIVTSEPYLKASFRQGIDEISETLKAFPESIQKSEIGGMFTPTPAEVAQEHGVFGRSIEQNEGLAMNQTNPVTATIEASKPGLPESAMQPLKDQQRGPTGDRAQPEPNAVSAALESDRSSPEPEGNRRQAERQAGSEARTNPVSQILDVARDQAIEPQITPGIGQEQDMDRGR